MITSATPEGPDEHTDPLSSNGLTLALAVLPLPRTGEDSSSSTVLALAIGLGSTTPFLAGLLVFSATLLADEVATHGGCLAGGGTVVGRGLSVCVDLLALFNFFFLCLYQQFGSAPMGTAVDGTGIARGPATAGLIFFQCSFTMVRDSADVQSRNELEGDQDNDNKNNLEDDDT